MAFKLTILLALATVAYASVLPGEHHDLRLAPSLYTPGIFRTIETPVVRHVEIETPPKYEFSYGVTDLKTGDIKSAEEYRDGDRVRGSYSLVDADGLKRTVDYTANSDTGFKAEVKRGPVESTPKVEIAPIITKIVAEPETKIEIAAPIHTYAAPLHAYAAPFHAYAAPINAYAAPLHPYAAPLHTYAAPINAYGVPYGALAKVAYSTPNHYTKTVTPLSTGIPYSLGGGVGI